MRATTWPGALALRRSSAVAAIAALVVALAATATPVSAQDAGDADPWQPVDLQAWVDMEDLTWDDYVPVPDRREEFYSTESEGSQVQYQTAVILVDFEDQPFLITQPAGTHPFGNPQPGWEPVSPEDVNDWFYAYYAIPNEFNGYNTLHSYWMENSHGRIGVDVEVFGPYTLPGKLHEYGLAGFGAPVRDEPNSICPAGDDCTKNIRNDAADLWRADIGCDSGLCGFDNGFYVTAGHDESSTWQEFGEMLFENAEDVPDELGPPGAVDGPVLNSAGNPIPNAAPTRYVEWTSWMAAANHWPNAGGGTSTQAESSGLSVFAHEFSHLRGLPDNYNNPFADNIRNYTGYWEMMSRGTFNGPGGTHNRWQVPNQGGSALGPHHTLHYKNQLQVLMDDEQVTIARSELAEQGVAVTALQARSSVPDDADVGLTVDFGENVNLNQACRDEGNESFYCPPGSNWRHYRLEVVDRVGNDSFTPGHGVLINASRGSGTPRVWMIDANPEDIGMIDFYRPDGTPVPVVRGDPRQLNDATFHAGTDSGSEYEYVDEAAGLHFYILDTYRDEDGVLFYDVAARSLDATGAYERGVDLGATQPALLDPSNALLQVPLTNTGEAGEGLYGSDVYRISSTVEGEGWEIWQPHAVVAAAAGETVPVEVYAARAAGLVGPATVTVTATSESDPSKTETVTVEVDPSEILLSETRDLVDGMGLHNGVANPLLNQLLNALEQVDEGDYDEACDALGQFLHHVDNREGKRNGLTAAQAAELRDAAAEIAVASACSS